MTDDSSEDSADGARGNARTGGNDESVRGPGAPVVPELVGRLGSGQAPVGAGTPGAASDGSAGGHSDAGADATEQVSKPTKLIRIASMVRTMLDEVRRAPLDDAGRRALREIHERALRELEDVLSPDLQTELGEMALPFTSDTPSESELRLAQAQLVGWLEGLFHGIQATLFTQQAVAQQQLEEMRQRRSLEMGNPGERMPGAYL